LSAPPQQMRVAEDVNEDVRAAMMSKDANLNTVLGPMEGASPLLQRLAAKLSDDTTARIRRIFLPWLTSSRRYRAGLILATACVDTGQHAAWKHNLGVPNVFLADFAVITTCMWLVKMRVQHEPAAATASLKVLEPTLEVVRTRRALALLVAVVFFSVCCSSVPRTHAFHAFILSFASLSSQLWSRLRERLVEVKINALMVSKHLKEMQLCAGGALSAYDTTAAESPHASTFKLLATDALYDAALDGDDVDVDGALNDSRFAAPAGDDAASVWDDDDATTTTTSTSKAETVATERDDAFAGALWRNVFQADTTGES
jgi:hypothetical protein